MIKDLWTASKQNKLTPGSILAFMILSAFLFSLTGFLCANLLGSVERLMTVGQTPDLIQMHAGAIDEADLASFVAQQDEVTAYQTLLFLNIDNSQLMVNDKNLADSSQDHGLVAQSQQFDYLLNLDDNIIRPEEGEIYLPISYQALYGLAIGQEVTIAGQGFQLAGFHRDSQMTAMMASSKRFLISETDMTRLLAKGEREYLIEFILADSANSDSLVAAYNRANLPANGPTITKPLIRLVSGLSDGMMIMVLLFASLALVLIASLCIRLVLLMTLEEDKRVIGVLKAIGYRSKDIGQLYLRKYLPLSLVGGLVGGLLALCLQGPITSPTRTIYGTASNSLGQFLSGLLGCVLAQTIILWTIGRTMTKVKGLSALSILQGREDKKGQLASSRLRRRFGTALVLVVALCVMLVTTPFNLWTTLASPSFVTYMGIGDSQVRLDIRQSATILEDTERLVQRLKQEDQVEDVTSLVTYSVQVTLPNQEKTRLLVDSGEQDFLSASFVNGRAPQLEGELALSYLYATEHGLAVGDELMLSLGEDEQVYQVCGIYSDVTNGGKTGKVTSLATASPPIWSVLYLRGDGIDLDKLSAINQDLGIETKVVAIPDYMETIYGSTIASIKRASILATLVALIILSLVLYLFVRLRLAMDRSDIGLKKAIGLTNKVIKRQYWLPYLGLSVLGLVLGSLSALTLGETLVSAFLKTFGAAGFRFVINLTWVAGLIPLLFVSVSAAVLGLAVTAINRLRTYQALKERG